MAGSDTDLDAVAAEIRRLDSTGEQIARVLRNTLDQLYDGAHTGRYRWDQLHKTEKTHFGTLVEINLHRKFKFKDGLAMDYCIAGIDVDCKYSQSLGGWMIPPESVGHLCLLVWADDQQGVWSLGIVRIENAILTHSGNRDAKKTIAAAGRKKIVWIFDQQPFPPNLLLQLDPSQVQAILALPNGQQRVDQIFRVAQRTIIGRAVIATLAQQDDYMKRVRGNGGSRSRLQPEGIIILGHYKEHQQIARDLEIPVPTGGELVSVRVTPASLPGKGIASIDQGLWRVATDSDPITVAPICPHFSRT